jgi:hypothetical protein
MMLTGKSLPEPALICLSLINPLAFTVCEMIFDAIGNEKLKAGLCPDAAGKVG